MQFLPGSALASFDEAVTVSNEASGIFVQQGNSSS